MLNIIWSILLVLLMLAIASGCMMLIAFFLRQGIRSVILTFREHGAIGECNAKPFSELGLRPKVFSDYFNAGLRDYRREALMMLMKNKIVRTTADNKAYLIEDYPS